VSVASDKSEGTLQTRSRSLGTSANGSTSSIPRSECDSPLLRIVRVRGKSARAQRTELAGIPMAFNIASTGLGAAHLASPLRSEVREVQLWRGRPIHAPNRVNAEATLSAVSRA
jgi:hypothetical protein